MPIPSGVDQKKSRVYIEKTAGDYIQILPEIYCEPEILEDSRYPVSSYALKQYFNDLEGRVAPFAGATSTTPGNSGTVPAAEPGDRNSFLRGDGKWVKINIIDEKVKFNLNKAKKYYISGTDVADTTTGQATFDTGVFVTENPGELQATKFLGNLKGNVEGNLTGLAERASKDADGHVFTDYYVTNSAASANYAPLNHKHPSSDVNALTSYSKGNSTDAISTGDTLNQALGKLEKRADLSATLNSPAFTGTPTTPNLSSGSLDTQIANKKYVDDKVSSLINGAGAALDTLSELANALGNDANFATTVTNKFNTKLDKTSANYVKSITISDNTTGSGQILKMQRGDDTTYTLNIKDTVIQPATAAPLAPQAQAKAGTSVKYAREDHVHPLQTTISGKAGTAGTADQAGKLTTPRKLRTNLASTAEAKFDGSADQLNIPVAGVLPVANGGTGASNLNGLVQTGAVNQTIAGTKTFSSTIAGSINGNAATATTATKVQGASSGTSWVAGVQAGKSLVNSTTTGYGTIFNAPTKDYRVALGTYPSNDNLVYLYSITNANVSAGTNTKNKQVTWNAETGELTANSFKGTLSGSSTSCTGNAASATNDSAGQKISTTYIKALSVSGRTITYTKGDNSKGTITTQDTVYTHPTTAGNKHIPAGGSSGQILRWSAAGTAAWGADNNTTYSAATQSAAGLMSAADKKKLDGMTAGKVGTSTVGSTSKPIYLNAGTPTAISATVGSASKPVYMNGGTITACSSTVGSASKPVYMNGGTITACSSTVGSTTKPVYMNGGTITASNATVGGAQQLTYLKSGVITAGATIRYGTGNPSGGSDGDIYFKYIN